MAIRPTGETVKNISWFVAVILLAVTFIYLAPIISHHG